MKFLSFELAKELRNAGFPQLWREQDRVMITTSGHLPSPQLASPDSAWEFLETGKLLWLPSFEDIMSHEYLRKSNFCSLPSPLINCCVDSVFIPFSGSSAVEAAARAWLFVHSKRQGDGSDKL